MTTVTAGLLLTLALVQDPAAGSSSPWAVAILPSGAEIALEIAADDPTRRRGYMYREEIGPLEGMLFIFDASAPHSMWMKNCRVPLDMIWLDDSMVVVEIAEERQPCPPSGPCPVIAPMRAGRYVLEVAGGGARRHGLEVGDRIIVHADPPIEP
ncbi:MAG: DUF192 domain-containing protein [Acidobacteriota bacterium]|nr:DUF192 domain-containing protein [Acidobacteriota bacterium]